MTCRIRTFFVSLVLGLIFRGGEVSAQDGSVASLHEFTSKNGQKVVAAITGLSEDRRTMKIRREDGQEFETEIVLLSLDDQQYVKDWMRSAPGNGSAAPASRAAPSEYRVETSINRTTGNSRDHRDGSYRIEERDHSYRIVVKNLSRAALEGATLEYGIVWRNEVVVYRNDEGSTRYRSDRDDSGNPVLAKRLGSLPLDLVRFNAEVSVSTDPVVIDRVLYSGNEILYQDDLLGLKIRLLAADGGLIHESHVGTAYVGSLRWEELLDLPDPRVVD